MQKRTRIILIGIAAALVVLAVAGVIFRERLSRWAFDQTGEEAIFGQVRGLGQLALNLTHTPLDLAPEAEINYNGVNPFGINTFLHNEVEVAKREESLRLISEAGFYWVREEFPWEDIEIHARGDFTDRRNDPEGVDAWAKYDNIVDLVEAYNLELIVRLSNPPAWSREGGDAVGDFAPPDDYGDFARFAAAVAERYQGRIRFYQVWNEPNIYPEWGEQIVNPEDYTDLLCRAYDAIKAADPDAVVLSGTLAPTSALDGRDFNDYIYLQRMYDAGAGNCFDILTVQGYGLWSGPTDRRMQPVIVNYGRNQFIRDIMIKNGDADKAIWISEMNWNVVPEDVADARFGRVTLEQQAEYAPLAYQRAQEEWPWVGVVNFWYFKRADYAWLESRVPQAYFQMVGPEFEMMPVYDSMKAYANQPPVMYPGTQWADHWAVTYGDGWEPWGDALSREREAGADAEPLSFTFSGRALRVELAGEIDEGCSLRVNIDGEEAQEVACQPDMTLWRGRAGLHTVEIQPAAGVVVTHFIVEGAARLSFSDGLVGGLLVIVLGYGVYRVWQAKRSAEK